MTRSRIPADEPAPTTADAEPTFVGGLGELADAVRGDPERASVQPDPELTYVSTSLPRTDGPPRPSEFPTVPGAHVTDELLGDAEDTSPGVSMPALFEAGSKPLDERTLTAVQVPPKPGS